MELVDAVMLSLRRHAGNDSTLVVPDQSRIYFLLLTLCLKSCCQMLYTAVADDRFHDTLFRTE